jgi:hypothetical protein
MSEYEVKRQRIKGIVRTIYDYQDIRVKMGNRLRFKADGSDQKDNGTEMAINSEDIPSLVDAFQDSKDIEANLVKSLAKELKGIKVYDEFLKNVKGVGPMMAAVIISEFDIHKAETISAMNQFAGLNPGMVRGKKRVDGELVTTDTMVRGDKLTAGFVAPFNTKLRAKMIGVLGSSFLKTKSPYAEFYYNYKNRLKNEDRQIGESEKKWNETTDKHRHNAAVRYMVKMFIRDLYVAWRESEGLTVRCPYEEEYLGVKHHYYDGETA